VDSRWKAVGGLINGLKSDEKAILEILSDLAAELFSTKKRAARTKLIKISLINLGHKLGYKVYANGLDNNEVKLINHGFVNREWVFDLHWYTEPPNTHYQVDRLPLVVEAEWCVQSKDDKNGIEYGSVKYDFQKILISNGDARLLIFKIVESKLTGLTNYFEEAIDNCNCIAKGSRFLFVGLSERKKKMFVCLMKKRV
jgi:hypothetical protein